VRGLPRIRPLIVRTNAAKTFSLSLTDVNGNPLDLSAYGARSMIRGAYSDIQPIVSLTMGSGISVGSPTNVLVYSLTASQATAIASAVARGVWDLYLDPSGTPDGSSFLVLKGDVVVEPVATR
jgi:hypothetical protein